MTTPGQQITTDLAVLNEVLFQLEQIAEISKATAWISATPLFLGTSYTGDFYIQIVPGVAIDEHSRQGSGYTAAEITVVCFKKLLVDRAQRDTKRIAEASIGLLKIVQDISDRLTNNFLRGLLTVPMRPTRRGPASAGPIAGTGWASIERRFEGKYRVVYPAPQQLTGL